MPHKRLVPHYIFDEQHLEELKQILPECVADGKINWESLRESLGEYLEDDAPDSENFGLFWPGKREARKLASIPSKGNLIPVVGEGIDEENTRNIFIEGENLEVLKLLQKSYARRIKMIYIDPPYNTGTDIVYEDDFKEPLQEYQKRTGQIDEEGKTLSTNNKADGRFHSKWLTMIYPRLRLARNLLRDDGVIFVSIDDNEVYHLRSVMNEIFGQENFVGVLKRRAARKTAHLSGTMSDMCDYVVVYSKMELNEPLSVENATDTTRPVFNAGNKITDRIILKGTQAKCKDGKYEKGKYKVRSLEFKLHSDLEIKHGKTTSEIIVSAPWRINQEILNQTVYVTMNFGFRRYVLPEELELPKAMNDLLDEPLFYNEIGSEELEQILGVKNLFDNPKPHTLIKHLIKSLESSDIDENFIVLDFFAGSGSTGHAIYKSNEESSEDSVSKQFILVQLPEPIDEKKVAYKNGFKIISEITLERLRKTSKLIAKQNKNSDIDFGFKVYKLSNSNYKQWQNYEGQSISELEKQFAMFSTSLEDGWKENNLFSEILLLEGFPLDSKVELLKEFRKNKVQQVSSDFCNHKLLICLDKKVYEETIKEFKIVEEDIFICLDSAITVEQKVVLSDKGFLKTI